MSPNPPTTERAAWLDELLRHFADLRDGAHGASARTRAEKEALFEKAVALIDPHARRTLNEVNEVMLLSTGVSRATGVVRQPDGGSTAAWVLEWAEQRRFGLPPLTLLALYGRGFHHPHLCGRSAGNWPLNVFNAAQAAAVSPTLRAIAALELHNLVFESDYTLIPATVRRAFAPEH